MKSHLGAFRLLQRTLQQVGDAQLVLVSCHGSFKIGQRVQCGIEDARECISGLANREKSSLRPCPPLPRQVHTLS